MACRAHTIESYTLNKSVTRFASPCNHDISRAPCLQRPDADRDTLAARPIPKLAPVMTHTFAVMFRASEYTETLNATSWNLPYCSFRHSRALDSGNVRISLPTRGSISSQHDLRGIVLEAVDQHDANEVSRRPTRFDSRGVYPGFPSTRGVSRNGAYMPMNRANAATHAT